MQLLSLACMPTLIGLALVAPIMIPLLFGKEWAASVPPFQALAALSIFYALTLMCGQILIAAGHAKDAMILSGIAMVLFLVAVTFAAPYGITYAAIAGGLANLLVLPACLGRLRRRFGIDLKRWLIEQLPCWTATAAMIAAVLASTSWMDTHFSPAVHLLAASLFGAATFMTVMFMLARENLSKIVASFGSAKGKDHAAAA
jgi:PST family polysaccharide transporter